jgi:hypothetical protein
VLSSLGGRQLRRNRIRSESRHARLERRTVAELPLLDSDEDGRERGALLLERLRAVRVLVAEARDVGRQVPEEEYVLVEDGFSGE